MENHTSESNSSGNSINIGDVTENKALSIGHEARASIDIHDDLSSKVNGLPNPYLGLCTFTYNDSFIFVKLASPTKSDEFLGWLIRKSPVLRSDRASRLVSISLASE